MGGSITMAARFPNGNIVSQSRWTNNYPWWIKHPDFFNGKERVTEYFSMDLDDDADKNIPLAPVEYGLIVFDYKTNHLLSKNTYSTPNEIHPIQVMRSYGDYDDPEDAEPLEALITDQRVILQMYEICDRKKKVISEVPFTEQIADLREMAARFERSEMDRLDTKRPRGQQLTFRIDTRPLVYQSFDKYDEMLHRLLELNFEFDDVALGIWKEMIDHDK